MLKRTTAIMLAALLLGSGVLACNINIAPGGAAPVPSLAFTYAAQTLAALTVAAAGPEASATPSPEAASATSSAVPAPANTFTSTASATQNSSLPGNALIITATACWLGPGEAYEVSSSIQKGTRVELLGRGDIPGWLVIRNPRYHDPCWMPAVYLQADSNVNVSALPVYYTPPTPTPTP